MREANEIFEGALWTMTLWSHFNFFHLPPEKILLAT